MLAPCSIENRDHKCNCTWSVAVGGRSSRRGPGALSLLPPTVHTPTVSGGSVALQRSVLTLVVTLGDEGSHRGQALRPGLVPQLLTQSPWTLCRRVETLQYTNGPREPVSKPSFTTYPERRSRWAGLRAGSGSPVSPAPCCPHTSSVRWIRGTAAPCSSPAGHIRGRRLPGPVRPPGPGAAHMES